MIVVPLENSQKKEAKWLEIVLPPQIHPKSSVETVKTIDIDTNSNESSGSGIRTIFVDRIRFLVLALTTVCLILGMCNGAALHFTVICMEGVEEKPNPNTNANTTANGENLIDDANGKMTNDPMERTLLLMAYASLTNNGTNLTSTPSSSIADLSSSSFSSPFTFDQQGWLFSGLAMGTLLSSLATDFLCNLLGFRLLATLFGLASGVATLATPFASWLPAPFNFYALFVVRLTQGFVLALSFVAAGKLSSRWGSVAESTLFIGVISTHLTLGRTISMLLAGFLCETSLGWPSVYYLLGSLTIGSFAIFYWFFRDIPENHRKVSRAELARIHSGRVDTLALARANNCGGTAIVPSLGNDKGRNKYITLLADHSVWAVFVSDFGMVLGNQLLAQYGPIYLKTAIGLSTRQSGFVAALPFLLSAIIGTIAGRGCDRLTLASAATGKDRRKLIVILTTSCPQYMMAICYTLLAFVPIANPLLIQCLFTAVLMFPGFWYVGIVRHVQLVAKSHSQALMSLHTAVSYFFIMLVPTFVNLLISQEDVNNHDQWNRIFLIVVGAQILAGILIQISIKFKKLK